METFIDPASLAIVRLSSDLPPGLLLGSWCGLSDFIICEGVAVCLSGPPRFRLFEGVGTNDVWRGVFVAGVSLEADVSSAFTSYQRDPFPGDLLTQDGGPFIATRPEFMAYPTVNARWGSSLPVSDGSVTGGFSTWRVVVKQDGKSTTLLEVNSDAPSRE